MIIHFPAMHPRLAAQDAPVSSSVSSVQARFFDPGLDDEPGPGAFRPENLPLDPAKARRILADSLAYGDQFKNPRDMVVQALFQEAEGEHSWSIRAELEERLRHDAAPARQENADELAQSQFLLILARAFQERAVELDELGRGVDQAWRNFSAGLGLDDDEEADKTVGSLSRAFAGTGSLAQGAEPLPWPWLLGAMAAFLPAATVLAASDPVQAAAFAELELDFGPPREEIELPQGWLMASAPAWKLAGRRKEPTGAHWQRLLAAAIPAT